MAPRQAQDLRYAGHHPRQARGARLLRQRLLRAASGSTPVPPVVASRSAPVSWMAGRRAGVWQRRSGRQTSQNQSCSR